MTNTTAAEVLSQIQKSACTDNDERFIGVMNPGTETEGTRQGDLYIKAIRELPEGLKETTEHQLAPGTSRGSRHVAEGNIKIYARDGGDPLLGPIIVAEERWMIRHPKHSDCNMPSGVFDIGYQLDAEAEERRRVRD